MDQLQPSFSCCQIPKKSSCSSSLPQLMLLMLLVSILGMHAVKAETQEVCMLEAFNATCPDGHVIILRSAMYGRMSTGRCIPEAVEMGCKLDVLPNIDKKCSGRQKCRFLVGELEKEVKPCDPNYRAYLQVHYDCIKVASGELGQQCTVNADVPVKSPTMIMSSVVTRNSGMGSKMCPWLVTLSPGQRVRIKLVSSGRGTQSKSSPSSPSFGMLDPCAADVVMEESSGATELALCGRNRGSQVYLSHSHQLRVYIRFNRPRPVDGDYIFLLQYEAVGCPLVKPPEHSTVERTHEHTLKVRCTLTGEVWYLACSGITWEGNIGNCTSAKPKTEEIVSSQGLFPEGLLIAIVVGVVLGAVIGISCLGLVLLCRRRCGHTYESTDDYTMSPHGGDTPSLYGTAIHRQGCNNPYPVLLPQGKKSNQSTPDEMFNRRSHVYESTRLPPPTDAHGEIPRDSPMYFELDPDPLKGVYGGRKFHICNMQPAVDAPTSATRGVDLDDSKRPA